MREHRMDEMDAQELVHQDVVGPHGEKLGRVDAIYVNAHTGNPEWAAVNLGGLLGKTAFAPVAQIFPKDGHVNVVWDKKHLKGAPRPQTEGVMSPAEDEKLRSYYGVEVPEGGAVGCTDRSLQPPFGAA
jgi:sporulation protein YlmC with PRC-barrel domain